MFRTVINPCLKGTIKVMSDISINTAFPGNLLDTKFNARLGPSFEMTREHLGTWRKPNPDINP